MTSSSSLLPCQTLVPALEAYDCLFPMTAEWPPPSFDVMELRSGDRKSFPAAIKLATGTQAAQGQTNKVTAVEVFGLRKFRKKKIEEEKEEEEKEEEEDASSSSKDGSSGGGIQVIGGDGDSQADDTSSDDYEQAVKGIKVYPALEILISLP